MPLSEWRRMAWLVSAPLAVGAMLMLVRDLLVRDPLARDLLVRDPVLVRDPHTRRNARERHRAGAALLSSRHRCAARRHELRRMRRRTAPKSVQSGILLVGVESR